MATLPQYREFADQCLQLAKLAKSERDREVLREMAEAWSRLAEGVEAKNPTPRP
jgi:hypothetical protein